jgi:membrane protease YdiL (CAAX protease family)
MTDAGRPDFLAASAAMAAQLAAQYGVLFVLVALVGWLRGRRNLQAYAMARPRQGSPNPLAHGIVLGLIVSIVPAFVFVLQDLAPIGEDTPFWAAMRRGEWDASFWLFMAISSLVVVPIVEEAAWRGYVLGRLGEGFAPGAAVLMTTLVFALFHVQYLRADAAMALTFAGLIVASLAFAFATLRTGSLAPAIIAHAVLNLPLPTEANVARIAAGLLALIVCRRAVIAELAFWGRSLWRLSTLAVLAGLAAIAGAGAIAIMIPNGGVIVGGGLLALFLALGFLRRSAWAA